MTGRVLLVYCAKDAAEFRLGGLENAVFAQVSALIAQGVQPVLWTSSRRCAEMAASLGAETLYDRRIHNGFKPLFSRTLHRAARRLRRAGLIAGIHHSGRTWFWGALLFPGVPHSQILHRHRLGNYRYFRNWIALSTGWAAEMRARHGVFGWRRVATVPNGMRRDFVVSDDDPVPDKGAGTPARFVTLGRLGASSKGFDTLVEACAILKERDVPVEIRIGGGEDAGLSAQIAERGVASTVSLVGYVKDVKGFLHEADVFVSPSRIEPFGLVIIEAMACGLPVIATRTHGAMDIVRGGETGLTVPIDDPAALADAIAALASDPAQARAMGRASHARVRDRYNDEAVGRDLVAALASFGARTDPEAVSPRNAS